MVAEIIGEFRAEDSLDRRGRAAGPRRSWASAQPFESRRTPFNAPEAVAGSWRQVLGVYRLRTATSDAMGLLLVGAPVMVNLYGASIETAALVAASALGWLGLI